LDLRVGPRTLTPSVGEAAAVRAPPQGVGAIAPQPMRPHRVAGPAAATLPSVAAAPPSRRAAGGHGTPAAHGGAAWSYDGVAGPAAWGGLRPDFQLCASGQRQSPIDIRGGLAVELEAVKFDYQPTPFGVIDNGHTVQVNLPPGNAIEVGTRRYELVQFHFHRPSEERIDGRQFELSLHLVHKDAAGKLAVVAVLLGKGPAHPAVQMVWNNLPLEKHEEARARGPIDPAHLLPADKRYFTYMGSLTTPPCSEGVLWVVMRTPVTLADEQLELFSRIYPMNARPVQPVAGRRIMQSQ
jgi:carbonic anhydrase